MKRLRRPIISDVPTGWLKVIALVFMFVDHAGKMLFHNMPEMRMLGRIAFPMYAWCLVVGFHHTRSVPKYLARIALVGLASQPLYMLALNHTWQEPNVLLTLLIALCALWGIEAKRFGSQVLAPIAAMLGAVLLNADYGWRGVLLVLLLYAAQNSRGAIAAVMVAMCLYWGTLTSNIQGIFGGAFQWMLTVPGLQAIAPSILRLQFMAVLAVPLMLLPIPRKHDLKLPQWIGYAIYPAHLLVLYGLELLVKLT